MKKRMDDKLLLKEIEENYTTTESLKVSKAYIKELLRIVKSSEPPIISDDEHPVPSNYYGRAEYEEIINELSDELDNQKKDNIQSLEKLRTEQALHGHTKDLICEVNMELEIAKSELQSTRNELSRTKFKPGQIRPPPSFFNPPKPVYSQQRKKLITEQSQSSQQRSINKTKKKEVIERLSTSVPSQYIEITMPFITNYARMSDVERRKVVWDEMMRVFFPFGFHKEHKNDDEISMSIAKSFLLETTGVRRRAIDLIIRSILRGVEFRGGKKILSPDLKKLLALPVEPSVHVATPKNKNVKEEEEEKESKNLCNRCGDNASKICTRCKKAWYCSKECQTSDWKVHRKKCTLK